MIIVERIQGTHAGSGGGNRGEKGGGEHPDTICIMEDNNTDKRLLIAGQVEIWFGGRVGHTLSRFASIHLVLLKALTCKGEHHLKTDERVLLR